MKVAHGAPPPEADQISQNIGAVQEFYTQKHQRISHAQRLLEHISRFVCTPVYLGALLLGVALWIAVNLALPRFGLAAWDPPPFSWLQGLVSLCALLTATAVLAKQDRVDKLAEHRAHLDLKVILLTEQKAAKLIDLLEELRRDLPNVRDRHDPASDTLQQPMDPDQVLAALDGGGPEPGP
jgi:uncharacterized membrane protein